MSVFVLDGCVVKSCFSITIIKSEEEKKWYLHLLEITRSKNEVVYVVHGFSYIEKIGFFVECYSEDKALEIYSMLNYSSKEEVFRLTEEKRRIEDVVAYRDPHRPWFFHPTNKYLLTDTFVHSF